VTEMGRKSGAAQDLERRLVASTIAVLSGPVTLMGLRELIEQASGVSFAPSTLRLRVTELEATGEAVLTGRRPVFVSRPQQSIAAGDEKPRTKTDVAAESQIGTDEIPLSAEARNARHQVHRPAHVRIPATYDLAWLEAYQPGTTWYLPAPLRRSLRDLGRTAYADAPAGTYARDTMERLIIELSWGSSRLEGIKYSRIDTEEILLGRRASVSGASDRDRQLILNHKAAIEFLVETADDIAFDAQSIRILHALLAENLLSNPNEEGALRTRPISIHDSVYRPTEVPQLIEAAFSTILRIASAIHDPMEQSFFVLIHLPYLQPFIDVNKRTARLAANIPFVKQNLCPISFVDVPRALYADAMLVVYEQRDITLARDMFEWAYARSCEQFKTIREAMGEPDPIRLHYRQQLRQAVADIIRGLALPSEADIQLKVEAGGIPTSDAPAFAREVLRQLTSLRPEVLARYGLRQSEYTEWKRVTDATPLL
jgi:Fic family protein